MTLLKVARIMSFSQADADGRMLLIPGVGVTYAVEDVGAAPRRQIHVGGTKCFVAGKQVAALADIAAGGVDTTEPWSATDAETDFERPKVASAERSNIRRQYLRGIALDSDRVDLEIKVGFGALQTFEFKDVPLTTDGR